MISGKDNEWECLDCSKKYKSYSAFYAHNKIKHNGNPPEKYRIPRSLDSISKDRGRPKVLDSLDSYLHPSRQPLMIHSFTAVGSEGVAR